MTVAPIPTTIQSVRRLAVTKQRLSGTPGPRPTGTTLLSVVRDLGYIQWDPVPIVAPSHLLSLWARIGDFPVSLLDDLLWRQRTIFQHWTPLASLVLTEDYPLYRSLMRRYPGSLSPSWANHGTRAERFLAGHVELRRRILRQLRNGPLRLGQFEEHRGTKRDDGEWSFGSDVSQMLFHLLMRGDVMIVGHENNQNLWGLSGPFLPKWVNRTALSQDEAERAAARRAIRALGTATPSEITFYFIRGRYQRLRATLTDLEHEGGIHRVAVEGLGPRDTRYVDDRDLALLESMGTGTWEPRLSLLPPFDNMTISTAWMDRLFGFHYVREQFLPREKRKFGTYVLPILWGDRFIGRIDPKFDRARGELVVHAVHAEPDAPTDPEVADRIGETIGRLATFLGVERVTYTPRVPRPWRSALH
ncbi:MAG: winged helix DNA-binding domain-containing protein [Thermoplasmata archaeon]|nr:winged helix DNA-binding domain-containing protein [Thermoplasmata archaeon]